MSPERKLIHKNIKELPVSAWIVALSQGERNYRESLRTKKELKEEFYMGKKLKR